PLWPVRPGLSQQIAVRARQKDGRPWVRSRLATALRRSRKDTVVATQAGRRATQVPFPVPDVLHLQSQQRQQQEKSFTRAKFGGLGACSGRPSLAGVDAAAASAGARGRRTGWDRWVPG
ncbi:hypothetical protein CMUS01_03318, partial [Colletotrichum musicola]